MSVVGSREGHEKMAQGDEFAVDTRSGDPSLLLVGRNSEATPY